MVEGEGTDFTERREHTRKPASWKAQISVGPDRFRCLIMDISLGGAGVQTHAELSEGTELELVVEDIGAVKGIVAWTADDQMGIKFSDDDNDVRFLLGARGRELGL